MDDTTTSTTITILGGTGDLGTGLALRWLSARHRVVIGSRTAEKALESVAKLRQVLSEHGVGEPDVEGMDNLGAAQVGTLAVLTVPFAH